MKTKIKTRNALFGLMSGLLLLAAGFATTVTPAHAEALYATTFNFSTTTIERWDTAIGGYGTLFAVTPDGSTAEGRGLAVGSDGSVFMLGGNFGANQTIAKYTPGGVRSVFATGGAGNEAFAGGLAFDLAENVLYVKIAEGRIKKYTSTGTDLGSFGTSQGSGSQDLEMFSQAVNAPPIANAGPDFSVNEGQTGVALNGSLSSDPDLDPLTYAWVQLPGGPAVTLAGANTASPTFTAPPVALGGETLSFELTVTAAGVSSIDTVSVTVVNINHPPVAEAGLDQSIAEGSPVTLHGEASFDIDTDFFTYAWVQVGGSPTVTLTGADTAHPTFTAPTVGTNGAPGVVATLVFELRVDDGFAPAITDAPAPGYALTNVVDRVTVEITNVNNDPTAAAGADQTVNENSAVALSGATSSDPDSDALTYAWAQVGTPTVTLTGAATATPSFTAPFVSAGGVDLEFEVTVNDGYGGSDTDTVVIHVQNINDPPLASAAQPTVGVLWPPNHQMVAVGITGVTDPNNNATITITGVTQDEPTNGLGDGDTAIDAVINGDGTVLLRSERAGTGNGRVYRISFTASDLEGSTSGMVKVSGPRGVKKTPSIAAASSTRRTEASQAHS